MGHETWLGAGGQREATWRPGGGPQMITAWLPLRLGGQCPQAEPRLRS